MTMELATETKEIIKQVEKLTNKSFKFIQNNQLTVFAKVKMARKKMEHHIIYYKSDKNQILNHIIAHECGHILRIFQAEPSKRLIPSTSPKNFDIALKEMKADIDKISKFLPKSKLDQLLKILFEGVITQITNFPVDLKIEEWIYNEYPGLREYQLLSLKTQLQEASSGLNKNIKSITPLKIYDASYTMNYAYFSILSKKLNFNFIGSYNRQTFKPKADKLIEISERYDNNFDGDIKKINDWAEVLNISDWFGWIDFEEIPSNYEDVF